MIVDEYMRKLGKKAAKGAVKHGSRFSRKASETPAKMLAKRMKKEATARKMREKQEAKIARQRLRSVVKRAKTDQSKHGLYVPRGRPGRG